MFAHDRSWKRSPLARTLVTLAAAPALSLLFAFAAPMVRAEAPIYALHDLGTLPGETFSIPWAINASGQIVGWSGVSPPRAFIYKGSGMVALPGLPGQTYTLARGINDAGVVVGGGWAPGGAEVALRWNGGVPEALGVIEGSSESWDINEAGVSIGSSPTPGGGLTGHAFMHTDAGGMVDIAPTGNAGAFDVNDRGDVTGTFNNGAFLWSPKTGLQFLGSLPDFTYGNGRAVNNAGQVAGFSVNGYGNSSRVWRYTPGVGMVNLGGVGESNVVWGMNSQGDIVGPRRAQAGDRLHRRPRAARAQRPDRRLAALVPARRHRHQRCRPDRGLWTGQRERAAESGPARSHPARRCRGRARTACAPARAPRAQPQQGRVALRPHAGPCAARLSRRVRRRGPPGGVAPRWAARSGVAPVPVGWARAAERALLHPGSR
jgi:probable HAF family extracellular repeat protein